MIPKTKEKQKAINLRKKGLSYSEILKKIPIAKSTLSVWLRGMGIARRQKQRLTQKRKAAQQKAQQACRDKRIRITEEIKLLARKDIKKINKRDLWLVGIALYWAEGSKQKETHVSQRTSLCNSDPNVIRIFLKWFKEMCLVPDKDIQPRLYIHEKTGDEGKAIKYWSKMTGIPKRRFRTTFKRNKIKSYRKIDNSKYVGLLNITVRRSTNLNRRITGWIEGIVENIGE